MAKLSVLHLSDIHIGNSLYKKPEDIAIPIIEALEDHSKKIDCVIVTGDIFDGKPESAINRKNVALAFLNYLLKELVNEKGKQLTPQDFIIVPGNHDIQRDSSGVNFDEYTELLKEFYGTTYFDKNFNTEFLYTSKVFEDQKVAFIGLNSCMVESCKLDKKETDWLKEIPSIDATLKKEILKVLTDRKRNEWDDYGYISRIQLRESFGQLESKIKDLSKYTIVACFHHHFYPFPEIYSQYGDSSIIRNFTDVIEKFQQKNVKIVLHGHKHLPIIRPVTNQKYLFNPDSIFYVFSAGSTSKKGVVNRSFQQIDIFNPNNTRIADICRFSFKQEELQSPEIFRIPPQKKYEEHAFVELLSMFKEEFLDEYNLYKKNIYENDNISHQFRIDDVISNISRTLTQFDTLKLDIKTSVKKLQILLYTIHYRINFLNIKNNKEKAQRKFLNKLREYYSEIFDDPDYEILTVRLLESYRNSNFDKAYDELISKFVKFKDYTAYLAISVFFTDLYMTFSRYGEIYYAEEKLKHNVNIKLESDTFHENIPVSTIKLTSNVDRRLATISFKCKNPTVHKIAVLIVKDFEKRINKIEDSFKQLGLKIYYLIPKVEQDNYDLDNLNFEAYIPTLLPLLTGENLYKKKEVFIRELIQNSLDAILLREDILSSKGEKLSENEKSIRIVIGTSKNPQTGKERKYLKITDCGIGMDNFKIERYFTSIGRSFYVSDEFDELQKNENTNYKPISNFGIGFLSAFMVSNEIEVVTKSYDNSEFGLEIHIPNYDGCFFIKRVFNNNLPIGTSIILFEDNRKYLNPQKIIRYIKDTFVDFQLKIEIEDKIKNVVETIEPHSLRIDKDLFLFCPIVDEGIQDASLLHEIKVGSNINKYKFGILIDFSGDKIQKNSDRKIKHNAYLNSGILLSDTNVKELDFTETESTKCYYNFPSSYIDLDVAREKILSFKNRFIQKSNLLKVFSKQGIELLDHINNQQSHFPLIVLNNIYQFFKINEAASHYIKEMNKNLYCLSFHSIGDDFTLSLDKSITDRFYVYPDFKSMIKIYYKILFKIFSLQPKLFDSEKYDLRNFYERISHELDKLFTGERMRQFEKEIPIRIEEEFFLRYDEEFIHRFESNIQLKFDEKIMHMFDEEFMHMFDNKYMHMFDNKVMDVFDEKFMKVFEKDLFHITENEFVLEFDDFFRKSESSKLFFGTSAFRETDENYILLSSLILSNYLNVIRRGKRGPLRMGNIYALFYMYYGIIIRRVLVSEAKNFKVII